MITLGQLIYYLDLKYKFKGQAYTCKAIYLSLDHIEGVSYIKQRISS